MSAILLAAAIAAGIRSMVWILFVAILSLRALRRGAGLEAEMKAPAVAFRFHLQPHAARHATSELPQSAEAD
jgi:hypothetical protein